MSAGLFTKLSLLRLEELQLKLLKDKCPVIIDKTVYGIYIKYFKNIPTESLLPITVSSSTKSQTTVKRIYTFLSACNTNRNTEVYVIGGGTLTDCAAFAVSTFKRGCRLTLVPSTLLGMIDASIGGKTALNFEHKKNLIGSFYPADNVLLIPEFQSSLPETEFNNGIAEMLKLWFIVPALQKPYINNQKQISAQQIMEYARAKLSICSKDLFDNGERRMLNLGHTFGHIIEELSKYRLSHGVAVAMGIGIAAKLSMQLGLINAETLNQIEHNLVEYGFRKKLSPKLRCMFIKSFAQEVAQDKKQMKQGVTLVLFNGFRSVIVKEQMPLEKVNQLIPYCV